MKKLVLNGIGCLSVMLGVIGIFLPLLPTTPFLLLAAACFARGSTRLHGLLLSNRYVGKYLSDYEQGRGIPARARRIALLMMWSSLAVTMWRFNSLALTMVLALVGTGVTVYLVLLPTRSEVDE